MDISKIAIESLQDRLGDRKCQVEWILDDLTRSTELVNIPPVDLWHDRAVLHFLMEENDRKAYFDLARKLVLPGGYVIIAVFNLESAKMCSGLPVFQYNTEMLEECLGTQFSLLKAFNYTYTQPSCDTREFVYTVFRRKNSSQQTIGH